MTKKNATDSETKKREREIKREKGREGVGEQEGLVTARHFGTWQFPPRAHDKNVKFAKGQRGVEGGDGRLLWACHS